MAPDYYPPANRTVQNFGHGNSTMPGINKLLLHSTETRGWPGYGGAGGHPTLTFNPWSHEWRQHLPILGSATALENAGSFQTNRDNVVQVEIIGYSDPHLAAKYGHFIDDIDDEAIGQLGDFAAWLHEHYGLKLQSSVRWKPYPASYGGANGVRLSVAQYRGYRGILGHQHAPGQVHGDPGDINIAGILAAAKLGTTSTTVGDPKPTIPEDWLAMATKKEVQDAFHAALGDYFGDHFPSPSLTDANVKRNPDWSFTSVIGWLTKLVALIRRDMPSKKQIDELIAAVKENKS